MFGSGFMVNATSSLKYNKTLVSKRNKFFKNGKEFFEVKENNQENRNLDLKSFENKLSDEEKIKLIEKLQKRNQKNLYFDYFVISIIIFSCICTLIYVF